jgi:ribosomal protein L7/L12
MNDNEKLNAELLHLLAAGRTIEAIKRYRQATGAGLAEAKAAIEALAAGESLPAEIPVETELERQVVEQLQRGRKIAAIKIYREATGAGLRDAKLAVEAIADRYGLASMAKSGCATLIFLAMVISVLTFTRLL